MKNIKLLLYIFFIMLFLFLVLSAVPVRSMAEELVKNSIYHIV